MKLLALVLIAVSGLSAHALKCEGRGAGCDYTVYKSRSNNIFLYATNCSRSDENGGGKEIVERIMNSRNGDVTYVLRSGETVTFSRNNTAVYESVGEQISLTCK